MKKKLSLKKVTIASLNQSKLNNVKGGGTRFPRCFIESRLPFCSPNSMEGDCPSVPPAGSCNCGGTNSCGCGGTNTCQTCWPNQC